MDRYRTQTYRRAEVRSTAASDNGTVYAIDIVSGIIKWSARCDPTNSGFSSPELYGGSLFVPDKRGVVSVIAPDTGAVSPAPITVSEGGDIISNPVIIEDGVGYFTSLVLNAASKFFAVNLSGSGSQVAVYNLATSGFVFGLQNGITYGLVRTSGNLNTIIAVDLANLVHQFFVESELMAEVYEQRSGAAAPKLGSQPSYRTHIKLLDQDNNPRILKSIKVTASEPAQITSGGKTYSIDTVNSAWLQTDSSGELSIVSTATTVTSPALYLWGTFMELSEAMVIYPDHDVLTSLSMVTGTGVSTGKGFDGNSIIPPTFRGPNDFASFINNVLGNTSASLAATQQSMTASKLDASSHRKVRLANKYIAYPGTTTNLLFQQNQTATTRTFVPGSNRSWSVSFAFTGEALTGAAFNPNQVLKSDLVSWLPFSEFERAVVNGVKKVKKIEYSAAKAFNNFTHRITDEAGVIYQFTVTALEDAVKVLSAVFKSFVGGVARAVEWLSYVFDWQKILEAQQAFQNMVTANFQTAETAVNSFIATEISALRTYFQGIENEVENSINTAKHFLVGDTLGSQQVANNNPQNIYGINGAKSFTKSRWLTSKLKENASTSHVTISTSLSGTFINAFQAFYTEIESVLDDPRVATLPANLEKVFSDLGDLVSDPNKLSDARIGDFLDLFGNIAELVLILTELAAEGLLHLLQEVFDSLLSLVNAPMTIPILGDIYTAVTGQVNFTVLGLFSLVIAVPASIIHEAANTLTAASGPRLATTTDFKTLFLVLTGATFAVIDGLSDVFPSAAEVGLDIVNVVAGLCLTCFGIPDALGTKSREFKAFFAFQYFPIVLGGIGSILSRVPGVGSVTSKNYDAFARTATGLYGFVMEALSIAWAVEGQCEFKGPNYRRMTQNIFTFLPSTLKFISEAGEDGQPQCIVLGVFDGLCDATALGLTVANANLTPCPD